jgi:hypothetical protein
MVSVFFVYIWSIKIKLYGEKIYLLSVFFC